MNDVDLSLLSTGPAPALAPASDIKARGDQRRQRGRVLVAGAAALVVLAGAGTAVALAGSGKPDALQVADPTPTTGTASTAGYATAFPTTAELRRADGRTWTAGSIELADPTSVVDYCTVATTSNGSRSGAGRSYETRDGFLAVSVLEYPDQQAAGAQVQRELDAFARCPHRVNDSPGTSSTDTEVLSQDATGYRAEAKTDECEEGFGCRTLRSRWDVRISGRYLVRTSLQGSDLSTFGALAAVVTGSVGARLEECQPVACDPTAGLPQATPSPTPTPLEPVTGAPLSEGDLLEFGQIGPVVVGMTLEEARAAAQVELKQEGDDLGGCVFYAPGYGAPKVSFMVIRGVVSRIDVDAGTTTTNLGVGIGATEAEVKRSYPTAVVSKHPYTDGHYLRVLSDDRRHALVFETDGSRVTSFRSGFPEAVDAPEGCA